MSDKKPPESTDKTEDILKLFKRGAEFTQDLLRQNEKLRYRLVQMREENKSLKLKAVSPQGQEEELKQKIESLRREKEGIEKRFGEVESENRHFAIRYVEIEEENNNLANLYISSFQLHSTLDFREVLQIIIEIIINLIGAEQFAILLLDEKTQILRTMATEGCQIESIPQIKVGEGIIGKVTQSGESYCVDDPLSNASTSFLDPIVCIPLKIKDRILGVIVIYRLLQQKKAFANIDYELFTLLAGHAATAIFSSKLYSESERKLSTIQGFINLLTK
jgi:nitrate/nitrite-specific signal transduction histidine kinase